jgi:hypothetical protein
MGPKEEDEEKRVQGKSASGYALESSSDEEARINTIRGGGQALPESTRAFFEPRFGTDFSQVRVHTDSHAAASARGVNALAYTIGRDVVFGAGQYAPGTNQGKRLLAHELTHVVQQGAVHHMQHWSANENGERSVQGNELHTGMVNFMVQRQGSGSSGGGVAACSIPSDCPPAFCTPFPNRPLALAARAALADVLLVGIAVKVSPRVVPLWNQYLFGGSSPQNLSKQFGTDFTSSSTTANTTNFLVNSLRTNLQSSPPSFPSGVNTVMIDLVPRIGSDIANIGNPSSPRVMDFNVIGEIPGNIAGGVGKTQLSCPVGARPSPFDDDRTALGTAQVTRNADGSLTVVPSITYTVKDTIDLCPGNCGASLEQVATVPMSRMEASGISGDVPFTVEFPAPPGTFTVPASVPPPAPPSPTPSPITGEVRASVLRIRQGPSTASPILGSYPHGTMITILCQTVGTNVLGNSMWDKTDQGFVSDRHINRVGTGTPPSC